MSDDFNFYCLTENPKGLEEEVNVIPLPKNNTLEKWWNEMYLFDDNVVRQKGENLFFDLPITFSDAALGTTVEVPSIDGGRSKIKIPPGAQNGKQFRLKGKGLSLIHI